MKRFSTITLLSILSVFLLQCKKDGCLYSSGEATIKVLAEDPFQTVEIFGLFRVELVQDSVYYVEGLGGSNVLDRVEASVKNDTLALYNYNTCFWYRDYEKIHLRVHFSDIKRVLVHETSLVFSEDSLTDNFNIEIRGDLAETDLILNNRYCFFLGYMQSGGRYKFHGRCEKILFESYYTSVIDASELQTSFADIRNYSIGDYKIWATEELKVQIHNRGDVYLRGNPEIVFDSITSEGKILPLN